MRTPRPPRPNGAVPAAFAALAATALLSACGHDPLVPSDKDDGTGNPGSPVVESISASPLFVGLGGASTIAVTATDPDGDPISYTWAPFGGFIDGEGETVTWIAPTGPPCCVYGPYNIEVVLEDGKGGKTRASVIVEVR